MELSEGKSTGIPTIQEELRNNGSTKARFYTDDDRQAVTVEIPIHPDFLNQKVAIGEEKIAIGEEKVAIEEEKVAIEMLRQRLEKLKFNVSTKEKIIVLFEKMQQNTVFGRQDVAALFDISATSAGNLIKKMRNADVIEEVKGFGKGKYRLKKSPK